MESYTLGIVDQSPVRQGGTVQQALQESVELAKIAEQLGYTRYWVAEHHNAGRFAGTAPEILIGQIAANTQTIKVGSGGVMLPHYAAFKVAETFSLLNSFFPNRIELGLGRAPGSDQSTAVALAYPRMPIDPQHFPRQVSDVLGFLTGTLPENHPFANVQSQPGPAPESIPEVWLLGSSDYSAQLAGVMGLPFSFAEFFGFTGGHGPQVADLHRERFRPSEYLDQPKVNVSVQVICAENKERAEFIATSRNLSRLDSLQGDRKPLPPPEEASQVKLHRVEIEHLAKYTQHVIQGDPEEVKLGIVDAAKRYSTTDINIVTNCYYFEDRVRSYEMIAQAFDLANSSN